MTAHESQPQLVYPEVDSDRIDAVDSASGEFQSDPLLKSVLPQSHLVQFYGEEDQTLALNVGQFLAEGLKVGGALVIASSGHVQDFTRKLEERGAYPKRAEQDGRLRCLDAEETLDQFMIDGEPYWGQFQTTIRAAIQAIRTSVGHGGLRVYGEMVGVLWTRGQFSAAIRLEQFWNRLLSRSAASLFCGYPIDVLSSAFQGGAVDAVLCAHSHVLPSDATGNLDCAIRMALRTLLGAAAAALEVTMDLARQNAVTSMPKAEANVLWIRQNLPERAGEILERARQFLQLPVATGVPARIGNT